MSFLDDADPNNRASAAEKLGMLGENAAEAIPKLEALLTDEHDHVREAAMEALARVRGMHP